MPERDPKVVVPAQTPPAKIEHSAAAIFIHGLGDSSQTFEAVAGQFQSANKLPYMQWVVPNAEENRDVMDKAWYAVRGLSAVPSGRPELEEDEDEDGMMRSLKYIVSLIDELVDQGIPPERIVVGGFSQGCALTLLTGLITKYSGKLGGLVGLCGYLPLPGRIAELRRDGDLPEKTSGVPIFLARGTKDMLLPKRFFTQAVEKLHEFGVTDQELELHEHEVGHAITGTVLQDVCNFLEKVLPPIEE